MALTSAWAVGSLLEGTQLWLSADNLVIFNDNGAERSAVVMGDAHFGFFNSGLHEFIVQLNTPFKV